MDNFGNGAHFEYHLVDFQWEIVIIKRQLLFCDCGILDLTLHGN